MQDEDRRDIARRLTATERDTERKWNARMSEDRKLVDQWEAKLKHEGLGVIDYKIEGDWVGVKSGGG